jgi:hypothetical protein
MAVPATPQRNLNIPGAFQNTPAIPRTQGAQQRPGGLFQYPPNLALSRPAAPQQNAQPTANQGAGSAVVQTNGTQANGSQPSNPIERAARIMNQNLSMEQRFPALDDYIIREWISRTRVYFEAVR